MPKHDIADCMKAYIYGNVKTTMASKAVKRTNTKLGKAIDNQLVEDFNFRRQYLRGSANASGRR